MRFLTKFVTACFVFTLFASAAFAKPEESRYITKVRPVSGVVAVVNGEMLSWQDLQRQSMPEIMRARINQDDPQANAKIVAIQRKVLDSMIVDVLVAQEAARFGIKTSDADVEAEIQKILKNNNIDMLTLERSLRAQGLSLEFLKQRIHNNQTNSRLMQMMVTHKVLVSQADIEAYYNEHRDEFIKNKTVTLQFILFPPDKHGDAPGIVDKIKSGALSFEKAAQTYSVGPSADNGGKLGAIDWENLSPGWRRALSGVPVGGLTALFQIDESDAVLKLVAEEGGEPKTLLEAEPEIDRILKDPLLQERFKEYTQQLRNKAVIDINM